MLNQWFDQQLVLGGVQAILTILLAIGVAALAQRQGINLGKDLAEALGRGVVQIVLVGSVLVILLQSPRWTAGIVLAGMTLAAAVIAARRAQCIPDIFPVALVGILSGSGLVIGLMTVLGVIGYEISALVPVGSMIIANCMNTGALALERFRAEFDSQAGFIETRLALGASPEQAARPHVQSAVKASLIPRIDSLRSLGIVWIPGLMAGMVLAGEDPIYAAIYQFVVIAMIFASSGLTALVSVRMAQKRAFSPAEQLILKPGTKPESPA